MPVGKTRSETERRRIVELGNDARSRRGVRGASWKIALAELLRDAGIACVTAKSASELWYDLRLKQRKHARRLMEEEKRAAIQEVEARADVECAAARTLAQGLAWILAPLFAPIVSELKTIRQQQERLLTEWGLPIEPPSVPDDGTT